MTGVQTCALPILPLVLYELSAIPALLIGVRNPFMLNSMFILVYYLLRDAVENKEKWFGKIEKIAVGVATPFTLVFMAVYAYIRGGNFVGSINPFKYIVEFFYSQGVTFNVIQMGYGYVDSLRLHLSHYTFGGIIDYIYYGTLGQRIWGTTPLPAGNCLENALLGTRKYATSVIIIVIVQAALMGTGVITPLYIQGVLGFSATMSGVAMLPGALIGAFMGLVSGRMFDRFGVRRVVIPGVIVAVLGASGLVRLGIDSGFITLTLTYTVLVVGLQFTMTPLNTWGVNSLPNSVIQHAQGVSNTLNLGSPSHVPLLRFLPAQP